MPPHRFPPFSRFMLDEWRAYARGMKSTADLWVNRNACWLSVCSRTDASPPPPPTSAHTCSIYNSGCRAPLWHQKCTLAQAWGKVQAAPQKCVLWGLMVNISGEAKRGAICVLMYLQSTFPLVACLTLIVNMHMNIPMCIQSANQLREYWISS